MLASAIGLDDFNDHSNPISNGSGNNNEPTTMDISDYARISTLEIEPLPTTSVSNNFLTINKMIFTNFKSYAGEQHVGPFDKSFTAVVGPNGSGKSNIIDGLLFVFGFRSSKLRQPKAVDLIHHSETHSSLPFCSVKVLFSSIDPEFLTLERIVFKDTGRSEYKLNGNILPISEINSVLLKEYGIDLRHHRWLILQGEVESISLMKSKGSSHQEEGLLEYLEDIIGTSVLIPQIQAKETEWTSASSSANLSQGSLTIAESELMAAKPAYEEALKDLNQFNEIEHKRSKLLCNQIHYLKKNHFNLLSQIESKKKQRQKVQLLNETNRTSHLQIAHRKESILLQLQELKKAEEEKREKESKRRALVAKIKEKHLHTTSSHNLLNQQILSMKEQQEEKKVLLEKTKKEHLVLSTKITQLKEKLIQKEEEGASFSNMDQIKAFIEEKAKEKSDKEQQILILEQELARVNTALNTHLEAIKNEKENLKFLIENLEKITTELVDIEKNEFSLKNEKENLHASIPQLSKLCSALESSVVGLSAQVQDLAGGTKENEDSFDSKINTAIGSIPGVIGRLGDLCTLHSTPLYDVAFERACGGTLGHWVVSTAAEGQKCIDELRRRQLGRATFIVLEELSPIPVRPQRKAPITSANLSEKNDDVVSLFDVVVPAEPRLAPAFYYAMRETLVAKDLEKGTAIAFNGSGGSTSDHNNLPKTARTRVVTLQGDLIEPSGVMSGGGSNLLSKKKNFPLLAQKKQELEAEKIQLNQSQLLLHEAETRIRSLHGHLLPGLAAKKTELEHKRAKIQTTIQSKQNQVPTNDNEVILETELQAEIHRIEHLLYTKRTDLGSLPIAVSIDEMDNQKSFLLLRETIFNIHSSLVEAEAKESRMASTISSINGSLSVLESAISEREDLLALTKRELEALEETLSGEESLFKNQKNPTGKSKSQKDKCKDVPEKDSPETIASLSDNLACLSKEELNLEQIIKENEKLFFSLSEQLENLEHRELSAILSNLEKWTRIKASLYILQAETPTERFPIPTEAMSDFDQEDVALDSRNEKIMDYDNQLEYQSSPVDDCSIELAKLERMGTALAQRPFLGILGSWLVLSHSATSALNHSKAAIEAKEIAWAALENVKRTRHEQFMKGFTFISNSLKSIYQTITLGGNAELELVDSMDPFSEGVLFSVMPPKKAWKNISQLSGGEKTLSSLALLFALHTFRPTPFYVMDEIDAALDFRNVSIIANYIKERTRNAQFIVVSLRNSMFEAADTLLGVYKTLNCTRSLSIERARMTQLNDLCQ